MLSPAARRAQLLFHDHYVEQLIYAHLPLVGKLVTRYLKRHHRLHRSITRAELTSAAHLALADAARSWKPTNPGNVRAYLSVAIFRGIHHEVCGDLRRPAHPVPRQLGEEPQSTDSSPDLAAEASERSELLHRLIHLIAQRLPRHALSAARLRLSGLSVPQIASRLGITHRQTIRALRHGQRALRQLARGKFALGPSAARLFSRLRSLVLDRTSTTHSSRRPSPPRTYPDRPIPHYPSPASDRRLDSRPSGSSSSSRHS